MGQGGSTLYHLEYKIGYTFVNQDLLKEAITHDSLRWNDHSIKTYQRLEYLGDSVLQLVITEYLFRTEPTAREGVLSQMRANLVDKIKLLQIAEELEISKFIQKGPGLQDSSFRRKDSFVEAIIGAVYVDAGYGGNGHEEAKRVIYNLWKYKEPSSPYSCMVM